MSFTAFTSSAGSGKTATLVTRYISSLVRNTGDYRRILALTFTNRAANEMKDRILHYLKILSSEAPGQEKWILQAIAKQTGLSSEQVQEGARRGLTALLHGYHDFHVSTLDSFMYGLVRTFAHDLRLPLQFDIEMDDQRLLEMAIIPVIAQAGKDDELTDLLTGFAKAKADEERSWNIERDLVDVSKELFREESQHYILRLSQKPRKELIGSMKAIRAETAVFEKKLTALAKQVAGLVSPFDAGFFHQGSRGFHGRVHDLAAGRSELVFKDNSYFRASCDEGKILSSLARKNMPPGLAGAENEILTALRRLDAFIGKGREQYYLNREILRNIFQVLLLAEVAASLRVLRKEESLVHISELNRRVASIIRDEPEPFIYERTGNRYRHVFIDEFQDTSVLQWYNMIPLVENALATGGSGLVVGDPKQAIYRFRNGEPTLFTSLPGFPAIREFPAIAPECTTLAAQYNSMVLHRNFRSLPAIVAFNNEFFSYAASHFGEEGHAVYREVAQEKVREGAEGYTGILFVEADDKDSLITETHRHCLEIIRTHIGAGRLEADIALLFRRKADASALASYLIGQGLKVQSADSLFLYNSPEVRLLLHLMRLLTEPGNQVAAAGVLRYFAGEGPDLLPVMRDAMDNPIEAVQGFLASRHILADLGSLATKDPFSVCQDFLRATGISAASDPFLSEFMELMLEQAGRLRTGMAGFVEWFDEHRDSAVSLPSDPSAVRIMTIHSAKGLQFPVVIYPAVEYNTRLTHSQLWIENSPETPLHDLPAALVNLRKDASHPVIVSLFEAELRRTALDEFNVQYVAFTRAGDALHIIVPASGHRHSHLLGELLSGFISEKGGEVTPGQWISRGSLPHPAVKDESLIQANGTRQVGRGPGKRLVFRQKAPRFHSRAIDRGTVLHDTLARIHVPDDRDAAVVAAVKSWELAETDASWLAAAVDLVVSSDALQDYFKPGVLLRSEMRIWTEEGVIRPDRVRIEGDKVWLAEFKTGEQRPEHERQVMKYVEALEAAGKEVIESVLVYTGEQLEIRNCGGQLRLS